MGVAAVEALGGSGDVDFQSHGRTVVGGRRSSDIGTAGAAAQTGARSQLILVVVGNAAVVSGFIGVQIDPVRRCEIRGDGGVIAAPFVLPIHGGAVGENALDHRDQRAVLVGSSVNSGDGNSLVLGDAGARLRVHDIAVAVQIQGGVILAGDGEVVDDIGIRGDLGRTLVLRARQRDAAGAAGALGGGNAGHLFGSSNGLDGGLVGEGAVIVAVDNRHEDIVALGIGAEALVGGDGLVVPTSGAGEHLQRELLGLGVDVRDLSDEGVEHDDAGDRVAGDKDLNAAAVGGQLRQMAGGAGIVHNGVIGAARSGGVLVDVDLVAAQGCIPTIEVLEVSLELSAALVAIHVLGVDKLRGLGIGADLDAVEFPSAGLTTIAVAIAGVELQLGEVNLAELGVRSIFRAVALHSAGGVIDFLGLDGAQTGG